MTSTGRITAHPVGSADGDGLALRAESEKGKTRRIRRCDYPDASVE